MSLRRLLGVVATATVALLVGALPAQAATSYPPKPATITIDKTRVEIGGTAQVTATGCRPSTSTVTRTATVTVTAPGHKVTQVQQLPVGMDQDGTVTATVRFTVLGANVVSVTCVVDPSGRTLTQSVKVTVVPAHAIRANHDVLHAGEKVTVTATGYGPGSPATVTVRDHTGVTVLSSTVTADANADANGAVTVTVPFAKAGTYPVQVLGVTATGASLSQSITITVLGAVMPHTGADLVPFSLGGVGLLIAGVGLVLASRRRRCAQV
ncbi:MAG TPA: LPXTG cell wall anchor domain-containing protein [Actinomycetes bacterium]